LQRSALVHMMKEFAAHEVTYLSLIKERRHERLNPRRPHVGNQRSDRSGVT
jgi:hypothetical protein